jgi:transposase-like protein
MLPDMKKYEIVKTYERCKNYAQTARECKVNEKAVRRWVKRHGETGGVAIAPGKGRKTALNKEAAELAHAMLKSNQYSGAKHVGEELHRLGYTKGVKPVSKATIIRHARAVARKAGRPIYPAKGKPVKRLTQDTLSKRLLFCAENSERDWVHVAFSDRKIFLWYHPHTSVRQCVWLERGEQHTAYSPNNPDKVNVYAAITKYGITPLHFVTGTSHAKKEDLKFTTKADTIAKNITQGEYEVVLKETLVPGCAKLFEEHGVKEWVFQQDNDPAHKVPANKVIADWNANNDGKSVTLLPNWPPNNPDLNIIENVWAWAQAKVNATACHSFEEFKQIVVKTLSEVPQSMLDNLFNSVPKRVALCIEKAGGKTKY